MTEAASTDPLSLPPRPPWPAYPHSDLLHHVVYEFDMLRFTVGWLWLLNAQGVGDAGQNVKNAALESFAIHVRNIIEFCYERYGKQYRKAAEFVADPVAWRDARERVAVAHNVQYGRASQRITHLVDARKSESGKNWNLLEAIPLLELESIFYEHLKDEHKMLPPQDRPEVLLSMHLEARPLPDGAPFDVASRSVVPG